MRDGKFLRFRGRLALFKPLRSQREYWEDCWEKIDLASMLSRITMRSLGELEPILTRYLPRKGRILEAGCGWGFCVAALASAGYDVEGVDYATKTVQRVRLAAPGLKIREGNVLGIDAPDGAYLAYISIGVLEHDPDGPGKGLAEARRVINPSGVALIAVPHLNVARRRLLTKCTQTEEPLTEDGLGFYQFYFAPEDIGQELAASRFRVAGSFPYGLHAGLTRDYPVLGWLEAHIRPLRLRRLLHKWCANAPNALKRRHAHMMLYVCEPY